MQFGLAIEDEAATIATDRLAQMDGPQERYW